MNMHLQPKIKWKVVAGVNNTKQFNMDVKKLELDVSSIQSDNYTVKSDGVT